MIVKYFHMKSLLSKSKTDSFALVYELQNIFSGFIN